jgi:3D (Asp-Asp-Asp) domain-containing protein
MSDKKRGDYMRGKMLIYLALLCLMLAGAGWMAHQAQVQAEEYARLQREILMLEVENALLRERIEELKEQQAELGDRMESWLDTWEVELWESTAYAPLDSRAIPGMCYSGNPQITTSGAKVIPYVTAAAGPGVEFGTKVYVAGDGARIVQDRGGRIGNGCIDLAMKTREEALAWGRRRVPVVIEK